MGCELAKWDGLKLKRELSWVEGKVERLGGSRNTNACSDKTLGTLYRGRRRRWISFFLLVPISFTIHSVIEAWSPSRLTFSILSFCSWANSAFLTSILPIAGCAVSRHQDHISTTNPNFPSSLSDIEVVAELFEELVSKQFHRSFYWSVAVPTHIWTYQVKLEAYQLSHAHTLCQSLDTPENWKWEEEILKKSAGFLELRLGWKGLQWRRRWGRLLVFHRLQFDAKLRRGWRGMAGYDGGWRYFASFLPQSYLGQE